MLLPKDHQRYLSGDPLEVEMLEGSSLVWLLDDCGGEGLVWCDS